jgi:hypothetical protein
VQELKGEAPNREWAVFILPICHSFEMLPWMRTYYRSVICLSLAMGAGKKHLKVMTAI